jgi:hypothetical protein
MYCPQCSQQQVSDEMRFCKRCGFPLAALSELVAQGGVLVSQEEETEIEEVGGLSKRQRAKRKGGLWMMTGGLFLILAMTLDQNFHLKNLSLYVLLLLIPAIIALVVGFVRFFHAVLLMEDTPATEAADSIMQANCSAQARGGNKRRAALPGAQSVPVTDYATARRVKTKEMVPPPSVTENTTRLLDEEHDS